MKDDKHIKALTRIKENYERLWQENLIKEEEVKEEYDAVCAGINALEAEPCEDCISRRAAIEYFMTNTNWHDEDGDEIDDADEKRKLLEDYFSGVQPVTPARKKGKWIVYEDCEGKTRTCTCNLCGYETDEYTWVNPNYCENCGAKMGDGAESEDEECS